VTSFEHAEIRNICQRAKQMNVWIELKNLSSKKEETQSLSFFAVAPCILYFI